MKMALKKGASINLFETTVKIPKSSLTVRHTVSKSGLIVSKLGLKVSKIGLIVLKLGL